MAKNNTKKAKNNKNNIKVEDYNCILRVRRENGYINMSLDIDEDLKDVKVRLIVPNVKLSTKIYHKVNKD